MTLSVQTGDSQELVANGDGKARMTEGGLSDTRMGTFDDAVRWLREQPELQTFVRQCYYDDPVIAAAARFCASEEWCAIRDLVGDALPGRVLELGAGRGIVSFAFACAGCDVTAVEPDGSGLVGRGAIEELAAYTPNGITTLPAVGESLPVEDAQYDLVFSRAVLHHTRDLRKVCAEVARVLKPGGVFLAEREHVIDRPEDLPVFLAAHPLHHRYGGEHAYLLREYQDALRLAGLRIDRTIPPFDHPMNFVPPMDGPHLRMMTRNAIGKVLPGSVAGGLADLRLIRNAYARTLSWRCKTPGRFFSFVARKPLHSRGGSGA